jgi:hypothetical protein
MENILNDPRLIIPPQHKKQQSLRHIFISAPVNDNSSDDEGFVMVTDKNFQDEE